MYTRASVASLCVLHCNRKCTQNDERALQCWKRKYFYFNVAMLHLLDHILSKYIVKLNLP